MFTGPCIVCNDKNGDFLRLSNIERLLSTLQRNIKDNINSYQHRFSWHNNSKCKYGLYCNNLKQFDMKLDRVCEQLNPYIEYVCNNRRENLNHEILNACRGFYPQVYREVEIMYRRNI